MAEVILLTPESLRQRANQIVQYKNQHQEIMGRMTNLMSSLSADWKGDAQEALVSEYMGMQSFFTRFAEAIDEFSVLANTTANEMEKKDEELARRIRALD